MTQPNILIIMVDQLNGTLFPDGPADFLHAPHLKTLAARSAASATPTPPRRSAPRPAPPS
jgi:choline-sulfatase